MTKLPLVSCISLILPMATQAAEPSLVFKYDFESPVINSATSTPLAVEPGIVGSAGTFDGSSWIEIKDSPAFRSSAWTISAWAAPQQSECSGRIIEKGASNSFWLLFQRGMACVGIFNEAAGYQEIRSATEFQPNEWHHVAGTYDGSSLRIYVDGKLEGMLKTRGSPGFSNQPLQIGAKFRGVSGDRFLGALDEVAFYRRALSEGEIAGLASR